MSALPHDEIFSPRERAVWSSLPSAKRRGDWALGRAAAKLALADLLEREGQPRPAATEIEVTSAESGAPRVADEGLAVSISHGHGRAAALALRAGPGGGLPGVDLERVRPRADRSLKFFLTELERDRVLGVPRSEPDGVSPRDRAAILLWALKEAAFKALQLPRGMGLLDVAVSLPEAWSDPTGRAEVGYRRSAAERHRVLGNGSVRAGWHTPEPDLILAWVVVEGANSPPD